MKVNASFPSFPFQHARLRNSARALWGAYLNVVFVDSEDFRAASLVLEQSRIVQG
jgi:hypothetical protein